MKMVSETVVNVLGIHLLTQKIQTISSKSPWSTRLYERCNQTLPTTLLKVKDDVGCDYETAHSWALSTKNFLTKVSAQPN